MNKAELSKEEIKEICKEFRKRIENIPQSNCIYPIVSNSDCDVANLEIIIKAAIKYTTYL